MRLAVNVAQKHSSNDLSEACHKQIRIRVVAVELVKFAVVGHVMVLYSPDWTNIGLSFILLTVSLFRHPTLIEHGL